MSVLLDVLEADKHQPTLHPGWDGQGVRLVCEAPTCRGRGLFLDIDLPEGCTVTQAVAIAASHVDELHQTT